MLCVQCFLSLQVGCQMGCTFCATGTMGLKGNLTCGEIIEQLVHARQHRNIRNIVFMVSSSKRVDMVVWASTAVGC